MHDADDPPLEEFDEDDCLDLAVSACDQIAQGGRKGIQRAYLHTLMRSTWPEIAKLMTLLRDEKRYLPDYESWEDMLTQLEVDIGDVTRILRVYHALLDLRMDPERYEHVSVNKIDEQIPRLHQLASKAERSTHILNLRG